MANDLLFQIFLSALIILVFILIFVSLKLLAILDDVNQTTSIAKKRAIDIDKYLERAGDKINDWSDIFKGFVSSFNAIGILKDKIEELFKNKKKETPDK